MLLANGLSGTVAIRAGEQVLANEAFDMACVAWHLLVPYLVVRSIDPILGVTTHVAKYNLVLINGWYKIRAVKTPSLINFLHTVENDGVLSGVPETIDCHPELPYGVWVLNVSWRSHKDIPVKFMRLEKAAVTSAVLIFHPC